MPLQAYASHGAQKGDARGRDYPPSHDKGTSRLYILERKEKEVCAAGTIRPAMTREHHAYIFWKEK
jgi:hypothetical protein